MKGKQHKFRNTENSMKHYLYINSIMQNPSLCDGPGYRTVLFMQGCDIHCKGCQNPETWDIVKGSKIDCIDLANILRKKCLNKKLTISGGEPLMQEGSLFYLLEELKDFDLCLYTGHQLSDVPKKILKFLKWIKVGRFDINQKTSLKPFVGSINQNLWAVENGKVIK